MNDQPVQFIIFKGFNRETLRQIDVFVRNNRWIAVFVVVDSGGKIITVLVVSIANNFARERGVVRGSVIVNNLLTAC